MLSEAELPTLSAQETLADRETTRDSLAISFASWLALFAAGALFATASLAPRWALRQQLLEQSTTRQWELVALEQEAEQWQRVISAAREDRQFAAEIARVEFDAQRTDEEILPVSPQWAVDGRAVIRPVTPVPTPRAPWMIVLCSIADSEPLRKTLLGGAGLLCLACFGLPIINSATRVTQRGGNPLRLLLSRYLRPAGSAKETPAAELDGEMEYNVIPLAASCDNSVQLA